MPSARSTQIPSHPLVAAADFGPGLLAQAVATAIARGLRAAGMPEPDLCPLPEVEQAGTEVRALLDSLHFDTRMRAARAVIVADEHLREGTLAGSLTFEIATRARQAGVPAYALTAADDLDAFDARILDLQLILEARGSRALAAAGRRLASLL